MILRFLFFFFLAYLLFKLVVDFVIPVIRTTRKVKKSFREMQQRMEEQQAGTYPAAQQTAVNGKEPQGDYIDFEEVKE
jgi:hypothetical protein